MRDAAAAPLSPFWLALGGATALASAMGIGRFIYTPILPPMAEGLGLTKGEAGLIASANFVGYLVGALIVALPRFPGHGRTWLLGGLLASAATTGAMGGAEGMTAFLLLRFLGGVASAFVLVFTSSLVLDRINAAGRGELTAVHFAGVGTGIALSAAVTWLVAEMGWGWRGMWFAGGGLTLMAVLLVGLLVPGRGGDAPAAPRGEARKAPLWPVCAGYGLFGFGYVITATFIVDMVRAEPRIAAIEPLVWLIVGLTALPSVGPWLALGRRIGAMRGFAIACVLEAAGLLVGAFWVSAAGILISAASLGLTFMGITALGLVAARHRAKGSARAALAIATVAFSVGQIVGPVVAGYGFDLTGSYFLPSCLAAAALCLGAGLGIVRDGR